ncbi:MAG TPA: PIN domain-containing protein [Gemmatimonadaceae bacterium]|nr:PIN domain-containing protein [Gemmatimonadaceae bacterium]
MSGLYALDTNVYITALRDPERLGALKRFRVRAGNGLRLHAVVALELRAGANDPRQRAALEAFIAPYQSRDRLIVPSFDAYTQAGRVLSDLATRERRRLADGPPSLVNDALLAASCREAEAILVTENVRDFAAIQRHLRGFQFRETAAVL